MTALRTDGLRDRIAAYAFPRGGVAVVRANRGYTLYSRRTDRPVARLRPTGEGDQVQVLWWRGQVWATPGDFGSVTMPLDQALEFIATASLSLQKASSGSMREVDNLTECAKPS